ncbi:MAG: hypothetical protein IKH88_06905, partial [Prevotella sp.]|nr:hypothetical protein [Prevotella sp.]
SHGNGPSPLCRFLVSPQVPRLSAGSLAIPRHLLAIPRHPLGHPLAILSPSRSPYAAVVPPPLNLP